MKLQKVEEQTMPGQYVPFETNLDVSTCSYCSSHQELLVKEQQHSHLTVRRKILVLLTIASLSLLTIVCISDQLIRRHFGRAANSDEQFVVNVLTFSKEKEFLSLGVEDAADAVKELQSEGLRLTESNGVFWSRQAELLVPPGAFDDGAAAAGQAALRTDKVGRLLAPDWRHCGREPNRLVEFGQGGAKACARNRGPAHAEYVQGEVMAFYLARMLGMTQTPAVALSKTDSAQWSNVLLANGTADPAWSPGSVVALIQWVPKLTRTTMPRVLRQAILAGTQISLEEIVDMEKEEIGELVQWTDLAIFDYLTGNYDRVASMLDSVEREGRRSIMSETVHNLAKSSDSGHLWFLDNESSFLVAYSLIYEANGTSKFEVFHRRLLQTTCIFRRRTIERIAAIREAVAQSDTTAARLLLRLVETAEPLWASLPTVHEDSLFSLHFGERLDAVWRWVGQCKGEKW